MVTELQNAAGRADDLFERFDSDRNGKIDQEEFRAGLLGCGCELKEHEINYLFRSIDRDRSGVLDVGEFAAFLTNNPSTSYFRNKKQKDRRRGSMELYSMDKGYEAEAHKAAKKFERRREKQQKDKRRAYLREKGARDLGDLDILHAAASAAVKMRDGFVKFLKGGDTDTAKRRRPRISPDVNADDKFGRYQPPPPISLKPKAKKIYGPLVKAGPIAPTTPPTPKRHVR